MLHPNPATIAAQQQTRAALKAMRAYFAASAQAQPHRERQRLADEWLTAVRRLRSGSVTR